MICTILWWSSDIYHFIKYESYTHLDHIMYMLTN